VAERFDERGVPYFVREVFDAFYPGYGETWPMLHGAVGMTYEQASTRGRTLRQRGGRIVGYPEAVAHHYVASWATIETATRNDRGLMESAADSSREAGITHHKGVYAGLLGPSLETPAEIRFLKAIGADAVGLSTVQEVIAAVHAGMKIMGLSIITNINDPDKPAPASVEAILDVANQAAPVVDRVISEVVKEL
jgi:purine nucleoside phosphorylase